MLTDEREKYEHRIQRLTEQLDATKTEPKRFSRLRQTHTVAIMELSSQAVAEISKKLRDAGYDHCFNTEFIDMTGIGVVADDAE